MVADYRTRPTSGGTALRGHPSRLPSGGQQVDQSLPTISPVHGTTVSSLVRRDLSHPPQQVDARRQFASLASEWREATGLLSSPRQIALHHAYQRIIGMGSVAVRYILEELGQRGGQWYWALHAITGASPVDADSDQTEQERRDAWLQWGRDHGYID
jgi:hypothetical protein